MSENVENKATRGSIAKIILSALLDGDKYGYEICKEIERLSNGALVLKQPSLYSSLRRMEESGFISSYWQESEIGGRRHYYSLTEKGKNVTNSSMEDEKMEELIKNLPINDFELKATSNNSLNDDNKIAVASQETLFNLTPKSEIEYIDETNKESDNNSFVQYDLFNQNIKLMKDSSKNTNNVEVYKNKYENMDNHGPEIEPIRENTDDFEHRNNFNDNGQQNDFLRENLQQNESISTDEKVVINQNISEPITRKSVFGKDDDNFSLNFSFDYDNKGTQKDDSSLSSNIYETKDSTENILKNNDFVTEKDDKNEKKITLNENTETNKDIENQKQQNDENKSNSIVWDNIDEQNTDLVDKEKSNDYKMIIGQLYNSSKLADPYEENKFFTFKEIFPSARIEEKKENVKIKSEYDELVLENAKKTKQQNIKVMQEQFSLQGLKLKMHDNSQNKSNKNTYVDVNRLNMHTSWVVTLIMLLEILFSHIFLKKSNNIVGGQSLIYFLAISLSVSVAIISSLENIFDRFKLIEIHPNFKQNITKMLIIFIFLCIIIFATCLICGMESLSQKAFLSYWLIPVLMSSNLVVYTLAYQLLYKTGKYNN